MVTWARELCLAWKGSDPTALLEHLMAAEACEPFGPVHHSLVGASLLTCAWPAAGSGELADALDELSSRASCVPGAACARWGVCGAAASSGMAFAILAGNAPLKAEGWSEGQLMVADILEQIARAGSPRCCKRDSRIAVKAAIPWLNEKLGCKLELGCKRPACSVSAKNSMCLGAACPYFPERASDAQAPREDA